MIRTECKIDQNFQQTPQGGSKVNLPFKHQPTSQIQKMLNGTG